MPRDKYFESYTRRCRICNDFYKTSAKYSKLCDKCKGLHPVIQCANCNKSFFPSVKHQLYCSKDCQIQKSKERKKIKRLKND